MELWQAGILIWVGIAYFDRRTEIQRSFTDETMYPIYERAFFAFMWWLMGLAWPYQRLFLPVANWYLIFRRTRGRP